MNYNPSNYRVLRLRGYCQSTYQKTTLQNVKDLLNIQLAEIFTTSGFQIMNSTLLHVDKVIRKFTNEETEIETDFDSQSTFSVSPDSSL